MKAKELRLKNKEELKKILTEKKEELSKLRFDITLSQIKEHRDHRNLKRDIARVLMIINEDK